MDIKRVAIIFDAVQRPETTGFYCRRALEGLVQVEHFPPGELDRVPRTGFDLYLNIDDGMRYPFPADLRPAAYWAIDTHMDFACALQKSRAFDLVFAAQRDGAEQLRRAGIVGASWLPLACDPEIHGKHEVAKEFDVAFVGHVFPGPRADLLNLVRRKYPRSFVGQCYFQDMARAYSSARIAFNRSLKNDVNMRVFEAVASGTMLATNDLGENGLSELFRDGVHLAAYRDADDLVDKLAFYLGREPLREKIAAAGRAEALAKHTYGHRMERLLRDAEQELGRVVVAMQQPAPRPVPTPSNGEAAEPRSFAQNSQDPTYFGHARPEVLALVPETARTVLDIGCGAGRLGEALKARQQAMVVGVELNATAAEAARGRIDQVVVGDIEGLDVPVPPGGFDAIVCGDILEHLRDPDRLLRQARAWLAPEGVLVASIPNVRHHSVIRSLLEGNWTYESAGLLDRDHVRFFTRREIEKLFFTCGYTLEDMKLVVGPGDHEAVANLRGSVQVGRLSIGGLSDKDAAEFYAYQYLIRARAAVAHDFGVTSIVIVTHNQLEYTRQCLDSIKRLTGEQYELIVVDNGSTDGTVEYLRSLSGVRMIVNGENRGFPAAANQGIAASTGSQVLLLNNDTVVTTGWLFRQLVALYSDQAIGLVGPCSNFVSGPQQIEARYESVADLDGFAWDWGGAHEGQYREVTRLVGFCLLIRRAVVDAIGLLDEQFGVGCFEDDDYCLRAIQAGFKAVIAGDAFVHHYGGRTFTGSGIDGGSIMRENEKRFRAKWSGNGAAAFSQTSQRPARTTPGPFAVEVAPAGGLRMRLALERPKLSLCMIVRDNARTLPACLESIRPWVDEMVIVDTGSVDETPRIVESFGGRLFHFPWCDDFSAARNESVRHARGDWVFWMDSDDIMPPGCGRGLRPLVDRDLPPNVLGFIMQVHCPGESDGSGADHDASMVDHVKLFQNRPGLRFDHRIHEQILPAIRAAGGDVAWTDLYVVHAGSDQTPEGKARKFDRDFRILHLELIERPEHPFTLFNLGMTYCHATRYADSVEYLRRGIARSSAGDPHLRKAFGLLMYALMRLGRREEAMAACQRGRELHPRDVELRFREAVLLHELGRHQEARRAYLDVLTQEDEQRHLSSVILSLRGFKTRQNLAVLANDMNDLAEAERQWREVVREVPRYRPGWRGLGETLSRAGRFTELERLSDEMLNDPGLSVEALLIKSRTAVLQGRLADARESLDRAAMIQPDDPGVVQARCQFLFDHGDAEEADRAFAALIERAPDDGAAHHNRGTLLLRQKRHDEAVRSFRQALRCRPNYGPTFVSLGYALRDIGRVDEAAAAWQRAIQCAPNDSTARQELSNLRRASV